jgi:hypothetical protein
MKMKLTYLLLPLVFLFTLTFQVSAQTEEGSFVVNGRTNLLLEFGEDAPFSVGLMGGYFLADNLALGVDINFNRTSLSNRFGIKPFARYYLFRVIFFGAGLRFDSETTGNESDSDFSLDLEVGGLLMLTDQVGLEPTLRVPVSRASNVALLIGFSFFFG